MGGSDEPYEDAVEIGEVGESEEAAGTAEAPPEPLLSAALAVEAGRAAPLREPDRREILADARRLRGQRTGTVIAAGALAVAGVWVGAALLAGGHTSGSTAANGVGVAGSPNPSYFVPRGWPSTMVVPLPATAPPTVAWGPPTYKIGTATPGAANANPAPSVTVLPTRTYPSFAPGGPPEPLSAVIQAAGRVGRGGPYTGVFGGAAYDLQFRWTNIYLTDLGKQAEFLAAMVRQDPRIDTSLARFVQVAHTRLDCEAEQDRIMAVAGKSFRVFGVSCSSDSAVLGVGVDDTAAAGAFFADPANGFPAPGFRIEVAPGTPMIAVTG